MSRQKIVKSVCDHVTQLVQGKGYISPLDLFIKMESVTPKQVADWRRRRISYIERMILGQPIPTAIYLANVKKVCPRAEFKAF